MDTFRVRSKRAPLDNSEGKKKGKILFDWKKKPKGNVKGQRHRPF